MNIYDEAIELRNRLSNDGTGTIYEEDHLLLDRILDELERAKKVEELLELYREKEKLQDERSVIRIEYLDFEKHPLTISIRYLKSQIKQMLEELK